MIWLDRMWILAICGGLAGCAGLALLALGGRLDSSLDVFSHFAPLYFLGGAGGLLLAMTLPMPARALALGAALVAMAGAGVLMAPDIAARLQTKALSPQAGDFKVIQFNAFGGNPRPQDAVEWLLRQDADIVVLEEGGHVEYELARRGGYHVSCGNCFAVILSKASPASSNTPATWRSERPLVSDVTFADPDGQITVMGVHRHWPNRARVYQAEMADLKARAAAFPKPLLIVAGDFNSTPWSAARRQEDAQLGLTRRTRALFSWPAERISHNRLPAIAPLLPIDHIYAGPGWQTVRVERGPKLGSDHYPVMVTLRRRPS
jgi:endonuclease/exonuclease/phosphatase (EEP) superfamily protein YafD